MTVEELKAFLNVDEDNTAHDDTLADLIAAAKEDLFTAFNHSFIGYELEAVTESSDGMYMQGHTSNYVKVYIPMHAMCKPNGVYTVRCVAPYMDGLLAEIV